MNSDELASFKATPLALLGDWFLEIGVPSGAKGATLTAKIQAVSEDVHFTEYPATDPSNRPVLFLSKDAERRKYWISAAAPSRQHQLQKFYSLPWAENSAFAMTLGADANLFVTARLNGCCVMIAGPADAPTVVHANCYSDELEAIDESGMQGLDRMGRILESGRRMDVQRMKVYDKFYWDVMGRLLGLGKLSADHPVYLFDPGTYGTLGTGSARVYGLRTEGDWAFYANIETAEKKSGTAVCINKKIWPT